jgi:hypothetical protein
VISPVNMSLTDWADSVILSINDDQLLGRLDDETRWQDWAVGLLKSGTFSAQTLPDPYQFADWRDWAMRAYIMLEVN